MKFSARVKNLNNFDLILGILIFQLMDMVYPDERLIQIIETQPTLYVFVLWISHTIIGLFAALSCVSVMWKAFDRMTGKG